MFYSIICNVAAHTIKKICELAEMYESVSINSYTEKEATM
jgi:hypothetical protein